MGSIDGPIGARAMRAWKARCTRTGTPYVQPTGVSEQTRCGRRFLSLRSGARVLVEYEIRDGKLRHTTRGPAFQEQLRQEREDCERREIEGLASVQTEVLVARALECLHAMNRFAKRIRTQVALERYEEEFSACRWNPETDGRNIALQDAIYRLKDRFLASLIQTGRASVGVFQIATTTREHHCPRCGRSWLGDPFCYECREDSGIAQNRTERWWLVDCGGGYRFHQPRLREDLARDAVAIEPHDPFQPTREVPDVGLSLERQMRCVEIAAARLEQLRPERSSAPLGVAPAGEATSDAVGDAERDEQAEHRAESGRTTHLAD